MSNKVYDEFCRADIPELTSLDRQLLGHYATRFNEQMNPPRAWPPLSELMLITGVHEKSISRSLGRLRKRGLLLRVTRASKEKGLKAEYAVNRSLLQRLAKVTDELPNDVQVTEQIEGGNLRVLISNPRVPEKVLHGYAKPNKPNKPKNVNSYDRFYDLILKNVPNELRATVTAGKNYDRLLDSLEALGATAEAICGAINAIKWTIAIRAGASVSIALDGLIQEITRNQIDAENSRRLASEALEALRNKASDESRDGHLASVRVLLRQVKESS